MRRSILKGAVYGFSAWFVYGCAETVLSLGAQTLHSEVQVMHWQWTLIAMLFGVYASAGICMGAAAGWLLAWTKRDGIEGSHQIATALTLVLGFLVNLVPSWPLARPEQMALVVAVALGAALAAALASDAWRRDLSHLAGPWIVSIMLIGAPWLSREALGSGVSSSLKTGLSLLFLLLTLAFAMFASRFRLGQATALRQTVRAGVVLGTFFIVLAVAGRAPLLYDIFDQNAGPRDAKLSGTAKSNVLLITMDTVRADHLSVYGYDRDTTPNLREFARTSTVYTRATATSDFTLPTHASIFTGMYPAWHDATVSWSGQEKDIPPLGPGPTTLAEALRSVGYWTASSVANYAYLGPATGLTRGFMVSDWSGPTTLSGSDRPSYLRKGARALLRLVTTTSGFDRPVRTAEDIDQSALRLLEPTRRSSRPFFLFLNYMDAHWPYLPDAPFDALFPGKDPHFNMLGRHGDLWGRVNEGQQPIAAADQADLTSQYDGGIAAEDAAIGNLLTRLKAMQLYDNTMIVIMADHGEALGEHGLLFHGLGMLNDSYIHIPLLIKYPGQHEGYRSEDLVSQVDLMPTILDSVGGRLRSELPGRSLLRPLPDSNLRIYSQASSRTGARNARFQGTRQAILSGTMKLITWSEGPPELYDLASDPGEEHNLYQANDPHAIDLSNHLESWVESAPRPKVKPVEADRTTMARLRSLGYVQ